MNTYMLQAHTIIFSRTDLRVGIGTNQERRLPRLLRASPSTFLDDSLKNSFRRTLLVELIYDREYYFTNHPPLSTDL